MNRLCIAVLTLTATFVWTGCGVRQSVAPEAGMAVAASGRPRTVASGDGVPPYPPQAEGAQAPLLTDAPVLSMEESTGREPAARDGESGPPALVPDPLYAGALTEEERRMIAPDASGSDPRVAALIPNRSPFAPIPDLAAVRFDYDADVLTPQAKRTLDANAQWMLAHPDVRVRVEGHCDERGTNEYNLGLGKRRADRVVNYLITKGVLAKSMLAVSFGEEVPLVFGHDESAWTQNRRAEFSYLDDHMTGMQTSFEAAPASR